MVWQNTYNQKNSTDNIQEYNDTQEKQGDQIHALVQPIH